MKAQFVYENMRFERGGDPKAAMNIGIVGQVQNIINKNLDEWGTWMDLSLTIGNFISDHFNEKHLDVKMTYGDPDGIRLEDLDPNDERAGEYVDDTFYINKINITTLRKLTGDDNIKADEFFEWQKKLENLYNKSKSIISGSDNDYLQYLLKNHSKGRLDGRGKFKILGYKPFKEFSKRDINNAAKTYASSILRTDPDMIMVHINSGDDEWLKLDHIKSSYEE